MLLSISDASNISLAKHLGAAESQAQMYRMKAIKDFTIKRISLFQHLVTS